MELKPIAWSLHRLRREIAADLQRLEQEEKRRAAARQAVRQSHEAQITVLQHQVEQKRREIAEVEATEPSGKFTLDAKNAILEGLQRELQEMLVEISNLAALIAEDAKL